MSTLEETVSTSRQGGEAAAEALSDLSRFLYALGDPTRQAILVALANAELNVGELTARFALSRPAISHQLKVLADAGLLRQQRRGRERVYRVDAERCRALARQLSEFVGACCDGKACC